MTDQPGRSRSAGPAGWQWGLICLAQAGTGVCVLPVLLFVFWGIYGDGSPAIAASHNAGVAVLFSGLLFLAAPAAALGAVACKTGRRGMAAGEFAAGALLAGATVFAAAGLLTARGPARTVTAASAAARDGQLVRSALAALRPRPRLGPAAPLAGTAGCLDGSITADQMVTVGRDYWLRGIPAAQASRAGRQALAYWKKQHYAIQSADFHGGGPGITAATRDGFTVTLERSGDGQLSVAAESSCIYRDGHPPR